MVTDPTFCTFAEDLGLKMSWAQVGRGSSTCLEGGRAGCAQTMEVCLLLVWKLGGAALWEIRSWSRNGLSTGSGRSLFRTRAVL